MVIRDEKPPDVFVGREKQMDWLERILFRDGRFMEPFVVAGPPGVGKTALIAAFFQRRDRLADPLWIAASDGRQISKDLSVATEQRHREELRRGNDLFVVLTDFSADDDRLLRDAISSVFNYKRVRGLIVESRLPPTDNRYPILKLASLGQHESRELLLKLLTIELSGETIDLLVARSGGNPLLIHLIAGVVKTKGVEGLNEVLSGQLYNISDEIPRGKIISVAKPQLIIVRNNLIESLKRQPKGVFDIAPRAFEELLAELLEDQGMEIELTQETRDGGRDILAHYDTPVGRILCLVEAKRYREDRTIGVGLVRQLRGTLCDHAATNAMMVTTSKYSADARAFQQRHKYQLSLKDYSDVVAWIQSYKQKSNGGLILP